MDYKERFRNTLKRLKSGSNIARYNAICTLTQNDDEQRVWAICRELSVISQFSAIFVIQFSAIKA